MSSSKEITVATTTHTPLDGTELPTNTYEWPTLDTDHDPEFLAEPDRRETERTTLCEYGIDVPAVPEPNSEIPIDDRDRTEQTSLFQHPEPWWTIPDVLDALYNDADCSLEQIAYDTFDHQVCPETVRRRLHDHDLMDREPTLAEKLADPDFGPSDANLSETTGDDSHAKYTMRGGRA